MVYGVKRSVGSKYRLTMQGNKVKEAKEEDFFMEDHFSPANSC